MHGISDFGTTLQFDIEWGKSILFARYFEVVTLFTDECPKVYTRLYRTSFPGTLNPRMREVYFLGKHLEY